MEATPLNQFVLLAKSAQGRACEALVKQALEHSAVFVFGELLDCPNVQALEGGSEEGPPLLELLQIFAYGTCPDYAARRTALPELSAAQRRKLQLLTIVSMATRQKILKFSELQVALEVPSSRDVEDIIIEAMYQDLVIGKMDQESQCLVVESCACRDCRDEDVDFIIETLSTWQDTAGKMLQGLDGMVQCSHDSFEQHRFSREELEKHTQSVRESLKEGDTGKSGGSSGRTRMADDADEESKRAKSTRGRWMGGGKH